MKNEWIDGMDEKTSGQVNQLMSWRVNKSTS